MSLTQMQLIQSLGDALAWLEREITWGVPPTELRHLCGRIGELYACVVTNGQMAQAVNEKGYDVRAKSGERISVKTTAMMGTAGHVTFNPKTLAFVDRVMVLRVNSEEREVEILFDAPLETARPLMKANGNGGLDLALSKLQKTQSEPKTDIPVVRQGKEGQYEVQSWRTGASRFRLMVSLILRSSLSFESSRWRCLSHLAMQTETPTTPASLVA